MRIYVHKITGVEVRSPFAISGEEWEEITPPVPPVSGKPAETPAEITPPKAVKKSGGTVRKQK